MTRITKKDVTARPWEYSASQWKIVHNIHQPHIAEISPMQYWHLSKQGKRRYDAKRDAEWQASSDGWDDWRDAVIEAYDAGDVTRDTPGIHQEAHYLILSVEVARTKQRATAEQQEKLAANQYSSVDEIEKGQQVYYLIYHAWGTVTRRNKNTVTVDFGDGHKPTIPPQRLFRTDPRTL